MASGLLHWSTKEKKSKSPPPPPHTPTPDRSVQDSLKGRALAAGAKVLVSNPGKYVFFTYQNDCSKASNGAFSLIGGSNKLNGPGA